MIEIITKYAHAKAERRQLPLTDLHVKSGEWLIAESPTAAELDALAKKLHLKLGDLSDVLDPNESPRLDHDTHHSYLYVRYPHVHGDGSTTTQPLLMIYGADSMVTVFAGRPDFLDKLINVDDDLSTRSPQNIMLKLLEQISADYDIYIKGQSDLIKKIITKMRTHKLESEDFVRFVLLEDQINSFLSALTPMVPLLHRVATSRHLTLTDNERDYLEDITLAIEQSIHICNANSSRIVSVREAYATLSNNSLNRTMKALTVATLLIALPNAVFGMYGMNIALPIQDNSWAFIVILGLTIAAVILTVAVARWRRWF
jgi:magnesium transporter